jgi:rhomboid family GlyGly-CTERM serine protease
MWHGIRPNRDQLLRARHNIVLIAFSGVLLLLEPAASQVFEYHRELITTDHQWWRLFTAHWVHLGLNHWLMNVMGLILVMLIFQQEQQCQRDLLVFFMLSFFVSVLMFIQTPQVIRYVGLSGVIHGYFAYYLAVGARQTPILCALGWLGTLAKVINEQQPNYDDSQTAELIGGGVAVDAHLYGFILGSMIGLVFLLAQWQRLKRRP